MVTILRLLDSWKQLRKIDSDNQAAQALGITRATISGWRNHRSKGDELTAIKLAEEVGEDPAGVLIRMAAEKKLDGDPAKAELMRIAKKFAAALLLWVMHSNGAQSHTFTHVSFDIKDTEYTYAIVGT
jgi:transcriptional regulator with XRE-family HTH domain